MNTLSFLIIFFLSSKAGEILSEVSFFLYIYIYNMFFSKKCKGGSKRARDEDHGDTEQTPRRITRRRRKKRRKSPSTSVSSAEEELSAAMHPSPSSSSLPPAPPPILPPAPPPILPPPAQDSPTPIWKGPQSYTNISGSKDSGKNKKETRNGRKKKRVKRRRKGKKTKKV